MSTPTTKTNEGSGTGDLKALGDTHKALIKELVALLDGGQAHATLENAVKDFPEKLQGTVPEGLPYSGWQLLEHMRITQRDILDFCVPPPGGYKHLEWPQGYWPKETEPPSSTAWKECLAALEADRKSLDKLLTAPDADLYTPFAWGDGQNLLREILLVGDHNAYHVAEIIMVRRLLGIWKK